MRTTLYLCLLLLLPRVASAQNAVSSDFSDLVESAYGILGNSVANLHAEGSVVWAGPYLNHTADDGATWQVADSDSLFGSDNRVFSIDIEGSVIWAGLGRADQTTGESVQTAAGFLVSLDGGQTFSYRFPQLDQPSDDTIQYGANTLGALPVIVPQQSPPFDIDYDPVRDEVWVAGWASGIRKSTDGGRSWQRVVLPPDKLDSVHPDSSYDFRVEPQRGGNGELNHMGFGVLVDETGTVWAGTPTGVNRSTDGGVAWQRFSHDGSSTSLTGSWVISIEEQPLPGRNPIWMATWNSGDSGGTGQFGVTVTRDGGESFEQTLHGERIYDFGFRGETVYAAGDNGLFVSTDGGRVWTSTTSFRDRLRPERSVRSGASVFSIAMTAADVWVGTADGLLQSGDGGTTWSIHRVEIPVNPGTPTARVPRVDAFAYPNPFSPAADRFIRIRYELPSAGSVRIRIFDFAMNLVRDLADERGSGLGESIWDGLASSGARVANGTYFYEVDGPGGTRRGKILVIE